MRKISLWLLVFTLAAGGVRAQDTATQQQIDKLSGQLQDIIDAEAAQGKRLDALEHEVSDLRDKLNTPVVNNYANADDVQKLAAQLQEIDRKRQADRELILAKMEDLAKLASTPPPAPPHIHHPAPKDAGDQDASPTSGGDTTPQKGYEHKVEAGETISAIAKAYREKGVKVTTTQIEKANPGLTPGTLYIGKTIFIPDPAAP